MNRSVDILLVDDREEGLLALEAVLKEPRFNLVKARSGKEALGLLNQHDFAVILLDVQMPGMDGFETARHIRKKRQFAYTPLIFVTAINQEDTAYIYKGYEDVKAVDYIFKPFDGRILHSKVSILVDLYIKSKIVEEQNLLLRESERQEKVLRLSQLEVENLKRYQNLADSIPHIVWRAKANGTMDYFNKGWTSYTGLSADASSGNGWQTAFQIEDLREFLKIWMSAMEKGDDFQVECRIRAASGKYRWHWLSAVAERDINNQVIAWLGTCTDIHKRKYMEFKLIDATKEADAASQAKSNFLANMSHEIRTPLNSIIGFTDLMLTSPIAPEQKKNLAFIKRNGQQLLKIIDEILDISKVETGRLDIEKVESDLLILLGDLETLVKVQGKEKDLEVNFHCLTSIPRRVIIDPTRYRQVLLNIINNAIKFTGAGKVQVDFSWERRDSNNGVLVCDITDTGMGIDPENVNKLFHPFVQVDSSMTRKFGGAGLGLALSRRLAKAMGGNVELKRSEKGKGSVFNVHIAASVVSGSSVINKLSHIDTKSESPKLDAQMARDLLHDVKVLVVDDSSDNRILMTHFLKAAGARVECANDGQEAINKINENDYQIVLMDIQMPVLDGYRATMQLRNQGYKKPIIALTAHALKEDKERSLKAGCSDHITKPVDRTLLLKKIAKYTGSEMQLS
jgi:two-component system, sensor histidine kinase